MYSYGPPHMAEQKQDDQLEHTYSSYVRILDVALKTCRRRWTIGRSSERGSGISVLAAWHDDDDDDSPSMLSVKCKTLCIVINLFIFLVHLSFSDVHFKKGPKYLTKRTSQVLIPLIRFLLQNLILRIFLVMRYSFLIFFFHLRLFDSSCFQYFHILLIFLLSKSSYAFLI